MLGKAIEQIRGHGRRRRDLREGIHGPGKAEREPGERVLERFAEEDEPRDSGDGGCVRAPETIFRLVPAAVAFHVVAHVPLVEDVAPDFADDGADHGAEVEEGEGVGAEAVGGRDDELWDGGDDADGPHEEEHHEAGSWKKFVRSSGFTRGIEIWALLVRRIWGLNWSWMMCLLTDHRLGRP